MQTITLRMSVSWVALVLSACTTTLPPRQALDTKAIQLVQSEIKRQVGVYMRAAATPIPADPSEFECGKGQVDFDIATVKAELTTTVETINNAGFKLKIPANIVTIGPSASAKIDVTNSQTLTYNLWPLEMTRQPQLKSGVGSTELQSAPIAQVLLSLREALIDSAKKSAKGPLPCFTDYNPDKPAADAGNTFKLALTFVTDVNGGVDISVGILDWTATTESKGTTGNTLTVSFVQRGLAKLQRAKDRVDAECKFPKNETDKPCKDAMAAFHKLQQDEGLLLLAD
jgi:hypothetical protein